MMSRPVAVARSLIVTAVVWGAGATVVVALFNVFDASSTIELASGESRVQIVWLGAHAFVVCVGSLLGVMLGASALTRVGLTSTGGAVLLVGGVTAASGLLGCLGLWSGSWLQGSTAAAMAVGLLIGTAAATFFVAQVGEPESGLPYGRSNDRTSRGWSTR